MQPVNLSTCRPVTCFRRLTQQQMRSLRGIASTCHPVNLSPTLESRHINRCVHFMSLSQFVNLSAYHLHQTIITLPNRFRTILDLNISMCRPVICFRRLPHQQMPTWCCLNIATCHLCVFLMPLPNILTC